MPNLLAHVLAFAGAALLLAMAPGPATATLLRQTIKYGTPSWTSGRANQFVPHGYPVLPTGVLLAAVWVIAMASGTWL